MPQQSNRDNNRNSSRNSRSSLPPVQESNLPRARRTHSAAGRDCCSRETPAESENKRSRQRPTTEGELPGLPPEPAADATGEAFGLKPSAKAPSNPKRDTSEKPKTATSENGPETERFMTMTHGGIPSQPAMAICPSTDLAREPAQPIAQPAGAVGVARCENGASSLWPEPTRAGAKHLAARRLPCRFHRRSAGAGGPTGSSRRPMPCVESTPESATAARAGVPVGGARRLLPGRT